ncbi:hypothetical protein ABID08_006650 [Rhizobium binae]|uniref:Uncharacterized protein n=1 Tax=Rhizobium binae TaxID=1138190 RepID=A0ABV2MS12_9HYPH
MTLSLITITEAKAYERCRFPHFPTRPPWLRGTSNSAACARERLMGASHLDCMWQRLAGGKALSRIGTFVGHKRMRPYPIL